MGQIQYSRYWSKYEKCHLPRPIVNLPEGPQYSNHHYTIEVYTPLNRRKEQYSRGIRENEGVVRYCKSTNVRKHTVTNLLTKNVLK